MHPVKERADDRWWVKPLHHLQEVMNHEWRLYQEQKKRKGHRVLAFIHLEWMSLPSHDRMNSVSAVHIWMPWRWQCSGWGLLIIMLHLDLDYEQQTLRSSGPVASFNHSDQPDRPREEENRNKKSCLSSMDGLRILADVCLRGMEIGWMGLRLAKPLLGQPESHLSNSLDPWCCDPSPTATSRIKTVFQADSGATTGGFCALSH